MALSVASATVFVLMILQPDSHEPGPGALLPPGPRTSLGDGPLQRLIAMIFFTEILAPHPSVPA